MIIKSLLFIIVCMFFYETYINITKMTEEYFTSIQTEQFIELSKDPKLNDISKTISLNCKAYPKDITKIMAYKPDIGTSLDTPYYSRYKPIEHENNYKTGTERKYYWRRNKLVEEGMRRSNDDDLEIKKLQSLFDNESDNKKKNIIQDELKLFKWRSNIFSIKDKNTGISREKKDILTDYYPTEIGLQRPWIERHSHIPDYSY
jgi:hypothetical protein